MPRLVESSSHEVDMGRLTAGVAELLRVTFGRERLTPPPPAPAPPRSASPSLLSALFAPEPLPPDLPPAPPRAGRWLRWLFAPESLEP